MFHDSCGSSVCFFNNSSVPRIFHKLMLYNFCFSRQYGFLKLNVPENASKKKLVLKVIRSQHFQEFSYISSKLYFAILIRSFSLYPISNLRFTMSNSLNMLKEFCSSIHRIVEYFLFALNSSPFVTSFSLFLNDQNYLIQIVSHNLLIVGSERV